MSRSRDDGTGLMIFGIILFSFFMVVGILASEKASCDNRAIGFENHEWKVFGGCMVVHKGRWLPLENIRGFDDE